MTAYIMNTKTTLGPTAEKREANEFFEKTSTTYFFKNRRTGKIIAAQTYGAPYKEYEVGTTEDITLDTGLGHRYYGFVTVIGWIHEDEITGEIATRTVPFYVFK